MNKKIMDLIEQKHYNQLSIILDNMNSADIALAITGLKEEDQGILFRLLSKDKAAETFSYMESDEQEDLITVLTDTELKDVISRLFLDDKVDLIEEMPANVVKRILSHISGEQRQLINDFLHYPADSAGSIMTIEFIDLKKDMTVEEAFARIRLIGTNKETIYTCYVLDEGRILQGIVTVKDLLLASKTTLLSEIMETNLIVAKTLQDREAAAKLLDKYDLLALPVVDNEERLVGIITIDDALDVMQEENSKNFEKMAAISPTDESYFKTSVWQHARNRITWLLILMLSATLTGAIITQYEDAFAALPLLVAFIPMLMDTGGNCGAQSSTLIIRGLAMEEIRIGDFVKVFWKEFRVALLVGAALAFVNAIRITIQYKNAKMALVVGLTLMATVILSKVLGCCLPILAKKLRLDPAIMAAPLITTIVDTCSTLIYFNIAMRIMNI